MEPINRSKDLERILSDSYANAAPLSYALIRSITSDFKTNIGSGGFGDVYLGVLENEKKVAVKKLTSTVSMGQKIDPDQLFESESDCFMRAKHGNVVRLLGYCADTPSEMQENSSGRNILVDRRKRFLCLEHAPNGDLQHYIEGISHEHDWRLCYQLIMGICQGLKYLHEKLIIHLDLKPKNILLDAYMRAKITDFGLSWCFDEGQSVAVIEDTPGTPGFIAPEIKERREFSYKADIFALGVIIVRLLMGSNSNNYSMQEWLDSVDMDTECPQAKKRFIDIARNCTEVDQQKRPTIQEVILKLEEMESIMPELCGTRQISSFDSQGVIQVAPLEMQYTFDPENTMSSSLNLVNFTDQYVAYMISMKNGTKEYEKGIIGPRRTCLLDMQWEASDSTECDEKFLVQSTVVTQFFQTTDFTDDMFKREASKRIYEVEVGIVIVAPSQPQPSEGFKPSHMSTDEDASLEDTSSKVIQGPGRPLGVHPLELHFPFEPNKSIPCVLQLTNITDRDVVFILRERCWVADDLLYGIVPSRTTYSCFVMSKRQSKLPVLTYEGKDVLTLESSIIGEDDPIDQLMDYSGCDKFLKHMGEQENTMQKVELKAIYMPQGEIISEVVPHGIKIISIMDNFGTAEFIDANPRQPWVAIKIEYNKSIRVLNYDTQQLVPQFKGKVLSSSANNDRHIQLYNYKTKQEIKTLKARDSVGKLAVHPTKLNLLSTCPNREINLWEWDKVWRLTRTFQLEEASDHYRAVRHVVFNPEDTKINSFACASNDPTVELWDLDSSKCSHTLIGHKGEVKCMEFFKCEDQRQYLITGSIDETAKIWDMEKMTCVHTLEGFLSPVVCVLALPSLPLLMTGTKAGIVQVWSSTDFRLKRSINIGCKGEVLCLALAYPTMGSTRVVIGQRHAVSVMELGDDEPTDSQNQNSVLQTPAASAQLSSPAPVPTPSNSSAPGVTPKIIHSQKSNNTTHGTQSSKENLFCDICTNNTHVTNECTRPLEPKPVIQQVGLAGKGLGCFHARCIKKVNHSATANVLALVHVKNSKSTVEDLEKGFAKACAVEWEWKAKELSSQKFLVRFPNAESLERMMSSEDFTLEGSGITVSLSKCTSAPSAKAKLHSVWVLVTGIPVELMHYEGVCESASMLGVVQEVDMEALVKFAIARVKVGVRDVDLIPTCTEVTTDPYIYDVCFEVESIHERGGLLNADGELIPKENHGTPAIGPGGRHI